MTMVQVLKSEGCKHCDKALHILEKLQEESTNLEVETVDITENPEILEEYPIMSTPGIVIDGELVFEGGVSEKQLRDALGMA